MNKILLSACLLGNPVRYDGQAKSLANKKLDRLVRDGRVIGFCPEVGGGLAVPRKPAEIRNGDGSDVIAGNARVVDCDGADVTEYFIAGAYQALELCRQHDIRLAVLTESSPSCGSSQVYDGSFSRRAVPGGGVTAALLRAHGVGVFSQFQLDQALSRLSSGEKVPAP